MKTKLQKIWIIFDIDFESPIFALCNEAAKLDKAFLDTYNQRG